MVMTESDINTGLIVVNNGMIIWLVVFPYSEKSWSEFVSWGYDIPKKNGKVIKFHGSKPPSRIDIPRCLHGKLAKEKNWGSHGADDTPADTIYVYYVYTLW